MDGSKILVVEDDELMAGLIQMLLLREGYQATIVGSGYLALESAVKWLPDLILLDLMMPGLDGYTVCQRLRALEETSHTPIIILTARATIEDKTKGFGAGANDYLTKPFDNAELLLRVKLHLRRKQFGSAQEKKPQAHQIAFFSLRGGSGCSTLAANTAAGLSMLWGRPVALVDLSLPVGSCDLLLNIRAPRDLGELARRDFSTIDDDEIQTYMTRHQTGVQFLRGIINPADADLVSEGLVTVLLQQLAASYHYVVVDTSHNFTSPVLAVLDRADTIIVAVAPDILGLRNANSALKILTELGIEKKARLVLNGSFSTAIPNSAKVEQVLGRAVDWSIPHDPAWEQALYQGKLVVQNGLNSPGHQPLENMIWDISRPDEQQVPSTPSEMWKRLAKRVKA